MSYTNFTSAGDNLEATMTTGLALDGSNAFTLVMWLKMAAAQWAETDANRAFEISEDRVDENPSASLIITRAAADRVTAQFFNSAAQAGASDVDFTDGTYDGIWVPVIGVYSSNVLRTVYIQNSSNAGTPNTTDRSATGLDEITIGSDEGGADQVNGGLIAECAIFNKALSTSEIDALVTGGPTGGSYIGPPPKNVAPSNCLYYWTLKNDASGLTNQGTGSLSAALTANGSASASADHPTITSGITIAVPTGPLR